MSDRVQAHAGVCAMQTQDVQINNGLIWMGMKTSAYNIGHVRFHAPFHFQTFSFRI